jgi:hypothetical protein
MGTKSAAIFIKDTGGAKGAIPTSAAQFGSIVNLTHHGFPPEYVEKCARGVMVGEYDSIAPSAGTDVFYVTKIGNETIATTKPGGADSLKKYRLVA